MSIERYETRRNEHGNGYTVAHIVCDAPDCDARYDTSLAGIEQMFTWAELEFGSDMPNIGGTRIDACSVGHLVRAIDQLLGNDHATDEHVCEDCGDTRSPDDHRCPNDECPSHNVMSEAELVARWNK